MRATVYMAALWATASPVCAVYQGFNYGAQFPDQSPKMQSDFEAEFKAARNLVGAPAGGFTSARLYTMIQWGTKQDVISAITAAIATNTSLLLGIWCSAGDAVVDSELAALKTAISTYGTNFTSLVIGISVGSEDLYRASPTGIASHGGPGASAATIARYVHLVRDTLQSTPLANISVGHVDTWTAWADPSSAAVLDAVDWLGMDAYPYWEGSIPTTSTNTTTTTSEPNNNAIDQAKPLFDSALNATLAAARGKPVWVTETGFPVQGATVGRAVPSVANAKQFWDEVGCPLFGTVNVWWYMLRDEYAGSGEGKGAATPSFGVLGGGGGEGLLFDISCGGGGRQACAAS